ncbi:unnamed protein product [Trichogramma brassicae]|uniref:JNK-interacting protein 3 n=1 Tax=Trichogramma brassicae TaxID=86971 RepID=A0A6H5ICZ5_9HYME|nr:unnamed protein product [Trichogramma brassicae]
MGQETVYGTHEDSHVVMSEKVQTLAGGIYQEFERMIARYDEDVVKELMPLLVNVLECLDMAYTENQEHEVELELLREDNEQLVTQYEREKQLRKTSDQKLLELEDAAEDERKEMGSKIETLESLVRMMELKAKNAHDHGTIETVMSSLRPIPSMVRLEEKESELKREYSRLHDRYTELFKTHVDYMERTKMLVGSSERLENPTVASRVSNRLPSLGMSHMSRSSGPLSYGFQSLEASMNEDIPEESPPSADSLQNEMLDSSCDALPEISEKSPVTEQPPTENKTEIIRRIPETEQPPAVTTPTSPQKQATTPGGRSRTEREERRSANTLYQEISFQDADALGEMDEGADITGSWVHPGEYASSVNDNFYGMGKEVENLILENNELLATKNALNIVKDDLIVKVDELTGEQEVLREEVRNLTLAKERLRQRVVVLEEELKKVKEEAETAAKVTKSDDEEEVPLAQRKRFTRAEMARVLMERNQYKERFMECKRLASEKQMARRANERREQYRQVRAHVRKEDGRLQAYGWSLPGKPSAPTRQPVPVPVYCRPLQETEPGMKASRQADQTQWDDLASLTKANKSQIWCGAGVNLSGGRTRDGGSMVGGSVFYAAEAQETPAGELSKLQPAAGEPEDAVEHLDKELQESEQRRLEAECLEQQLSSLVWICTSTQKMSKVTVIDANNPADILEVFNVCPSHLLCIASVPGAKESDYVGEVDVQAELALADKDDSTKEDDKPESEEQPSSTSETPVEVDAETANLGAVRFIKCEAIPDSPEADTTNKESEKIGEDEHDVVIDDDETEDDEEEEVVATPIERMSSVQPTMWLGAQDGTVFVHSAVAKWSVCLHSVKLPDAALAIVHIQGRVLVALADGTVAIFRRGVDGQWDLSQYHIITLGSPQHSIRCMTVVLGKTVWCGYRNKIHVIDPIKMKLECTVDAHPRRESQVRQLAWLGEGVWVSIRLDSTLRLYHAHTYQHLQDVDIEPYVSKMLGTGKLGFSFVRITALLISSNRLWIGTGNGVIISVPLSESAGGSMAVTRVQPGTTGSKNDAPGVGVRVFASDHSVSPGSFVPYCSMAHAQLSFHGHRDAVKMFVAVPGHGGQSAASDNSQPAMLVLSGGEGYIDFRVADEAEDESDVATHLIVWQLVRR